MCRKRATSWIRNEEQNLIPSQHHLKKEFEDGKSNLKEIINVIERKNGNTVNFLF